jgi:transcriptional regulator with XRE-family HTH domain
MSTQPDGQVISLAERLKQRREELGLSQAQAARELDVARTAYRLWEMEAAKPQPDRWSLISRWLGVPVTTILLIDEPSDDKTLSAASRRRADTESRTVLNDPRSFFTAIRSIVQEAAEKRFTSSEEAEELLRIMAQIEKKQHGTDTEAWEPTSLHKQLGITPQSPRRARKAIEFVAGDLPNNIVEDARLLTSELVSNSVKYAATTSATIDLDIEINRDRIRVEVRDGALTSPTLTKPTENGGYGLNFVDHLASRWGSQREHGGNLTWFEIDLTAPGE